jgi:hypothetical protein
MKDRIWLVIMVGWRSQHSFYGEELINLKTNKKRRFAERNLSGASAVDRSFESRPTDWGSNPGSSL